ncbi:MAG: hypothetical protein CMF24_08760 [Ilumatobacter sp.]|nr:hypothetical protein [Ilumatobacter sp.]
MVGKPIPSGVSAGSAATPAFSNTSTVDYRSGHATAAPAPHSYAPAPHPYARLYEGASAPLRDSAFTREFAPHASAAGYSRDFPRGCGADFPRSFGARAYPLRDYAQREYSAPLRESTAVPVRARATPDLDSLTASLSHEVMKSVGGKTESAPAGDVVVKGAQPAAAPAAPAAPGPAVDKLRHDMLGLKQDMRRAMDEIVSERKTKTEITKAMSAIVSKMNADKQTTNQALGIVADKLAAHKASTGAQLSAHEKATNLQHAAHAGKYASAGEHEKLVGLLAEMVGKMEKGKHERAQTASAVRELAKQVAARPATTSLDASALANLSKKIKQ